MARIVDGAVPATLETDQLDFKRQPDSRDDAIKVLVDAAVCFANSEGGTVVMGVTNGTGGPEAVAGCSLDLAVVQRRIHAGHGSVSDLGGPFEIITSGVTNSLSSPAVRARAARRVG